MLYRIRKVEISICLCLLSFFLLFTVGTLFLSKDRKEGHGESVKEAVATTEEGKVAVPIIMYHSVCDNKRVTSDYRVTPEVFESDMKYLCDNGYTAIYVADIVAYVYEGYPLPEKPIVITLDDGYLNNLTEVLPILEKYDMCATVSVVGEFVDSAVKENDPNPMYAYLTWEDIRALEDSGRIEIGNHTNSMHEIGERRGCMKISGESEDNYSKVLSDDLMTLQTSLSEKSGLTPIVFTYPFGFVSEESLPVIKKLGFLAALTCHEKINYIEGRPEQLYKLGRFNRTPGMSTEQFMKKIGV